MLKASGWTLTASIEDYVRQMWSGFGQTKLIEDANQKQREHESRGQASRRVRRARRWSIPVQHELLKQYGRSEIEPPDEILGTPNAQEEWFDPATHGHGELDLKRIKGVPIWPTLTPEGWNQQSAELSMTAFCMEGNPHRAAELWHVDVMPLHEILQVKEQEFRLVLYIAPGVAALMWPMDVHNDGDCAYLSLSKIDNLAWVPVTQLDSIAVLPCKVVAPAHLWSRKHRLGETGLPNTPTQTYLF